MQISKSILTDLVLSMMVQERSEASNVQRSIKHNGQYWVFHLFFYKTHCSISLRALLAFAGVLQKKNLNMCRFQELYDKLHVYISSKLFFCYKLSGDDKLPNNGRLFN